MLLSDYDADGYQDILFRELDDWPGLNARPLHAQSLQK